MTVYTIWFSLFAIICFLIFTDQSLEKGLYLFVQYILIKYEKIKWIILHHPANPLVKWLIWQRSIKQAKEIEKLINNKNKE